MKKSRISLNMVILAGLTIISGCITEKKPAPPPPKPVIVERTPQPPQESPEKITERAARALAQNELDAGIGLYNDGDYLGAIKRFGSAEDSLRPYKEMELQAIKYTAFSYCLTSHTALCKSQFEKAVKLDPSFDLAPGEKGHPLWGPVFDRVKKKESN